MNRLNQNNNQFQIQFQPNTNTVDRQTVVQLTPTSVPVSIQPVLQNSQSINQFQMTNSNSVPFYLTTDCKQTNYKVQTNLVSGYENNDKNIVQNQTFITSDNISNNQAPQMVTITTSPSPSNQQKALTGIPSNIANVFLNKPGITINRVVNTQNQTSAVSTPSVECTSTVSPSQTHKTDDLESKESEEPSVPMNPVSRTLTATVSEFKCKICLKSFKKKEHMTQHMKLHAGLRPFKCNENYCNKAFSRKEHLMRHMVSHTGKKLFHCDICQKFFSRKDNLNKHRRTHTENSNNGGFVCEVCQKCFVVKMYYVQHKLQCLKDVSRAPNNVKLNET